MLPALARFVETAADAAAELELVKQNSSFQRSAAFRLAGADK